MKNLILPILALALIALSGCQTLKTSYGIGRTPPVIDSPDRHYGDSAQDKRHIARLAKIKAESPEAFKAAQKAEFDPVTRSQIIRSSKRSQSYGVVETFEILGN